MTSKQEVIDAVSQFVTLRTPDQTFTFLHNLIPTWLTDEQKASRSLFVDRNSATQYFKGIVAELLSDCVFILFQVMVPLFSTPLRTENNIKTLGKRIRVDGVLINNPKFFHPVIVICLIMFYGLGFAFCVDTTLQIT